MSHEEQTTSLHSALAGDLIMNAKAHYGEITPELVRQVTEQVYLLFLRDLRLERERAAPQHTTSSLRRRW